MQRLSLQSRRAFWPVTLISGILTFSSFLLLLLAYWFTNQWQYLLVTGLIGLMALGHVVAWWIGYWQQQFAIAIWLIMLVKILTSALVPLFIADYWLLGLLLLAIVSLEVGLGYKPDQLPLATVIALLGGILMLAIDLLGFPDRVLGFQQLPQLYFLAIGFLMFHIISLAFLLWYYYLRPEIIHTAGLNLTTQLSLIFTIITIISVGPIIGVLIFQIRTTQIEQAQDNLQILAQINADRTKDTLQQEIEALQNVALQEPTLLEKLELVNQTYPVSEEDIVTFLSSREEAWQQTDIEDPLPQAYLDKGAGEFLMRFQNSRLDQSNLILIDKMGGLVAALGDKPVHFSFRDEAWWQSIWEDDSEGVYIGDVMLHPVTQAMTVFMATAVLDPDTDEPVGVLAADYDLRAVQRDIDLVNTQINGQIFLISNDNIIIAGPEAENVGRFADEGLQSATSEPIVVPIENQANWVLARENVGSTTVSGRGLFTEVEVDRFSSLERLNWQVIVSDTQANLLGGVIQSTKIASMVGLSVIMLVVLVAINLARLITRPVESLTTTAALMSEGQLDKYAEPVGPIEFVTLAKTFNVLATRLRSLINNLQDQVAERTGQLETRVEQLATLNRVAESTASIRNLSDELNDVAQDIAEIFNADHCGITLLNANQTALTVVADYSKLGQTFSVAGATLPLRDNPSSTHVVETGQSLIILDPQTSIETAGVHDLMRQRQTYCLMIVPMMMRGQVIGTIGLDSTDPNFSFSPTDQNFAETLAGQIAGTIENARLFSEVSHQRKIAESLRQVALTLSSSLSQDDVLQKILEQLRFVLHFDSAGILLQEDNSLIIADGLGFLKPDQVIGYRLSLRSNDPSVRVFREQSLLVIQDVQNDPNWVDLPGTENIHSWMGIPLITGEQPIGVLTVDRFELGPYTEDDQQIAQTFAYQAAIAIENSLLYKEAAEATVEAEQANKAKSLFLANMSHELRTPLNAIIGYSEILLEEMQDVTESQFASDLQKIRSAGKHLMSLINDILDISKIEAGKMELYLETFSLLDLVQDVVHTVQPLIKTNVNQLIVEYENDLGEMYADPVKVRQSLLNLLSNAGKFTKQGSVTLRCSRETLRGTDWVIFDISDSGIGMTPDQLDKLFQSFTQADSSTTRRFGGTGLGLSISKHFCEMMQGGITVKSEFGVGSTFTITLPARVGRTRTRTKTNPKLLEKSAL